MTAQELKAHGYKNILNSKKQGEIDFLIDYNGYVLPIEIKSGKDYTVLSSLTKIMDNKNYQIFQGLFSPIYNVYVDVHKEGNSSREYDIYS